FQVAVPPVPLCCGLTWISTGQLGVAERVLRRTLRALGPPLEAGVPVVGLEPSCTAVFRAGAPELLSGDPLVERLAAQAHSPAVLADGFSCRTQIEAGTEARPRHLAEVLADLL